MDSKDDVTAHDLLFQKEEGVIEQDVDSDSASVDSIQLLADIAEAINSYKEGTVEDFFGTDTTEDVEECAQPEAGPMASNVLNDESSKSIVMPDADVKKSEKSPSKIGQSETSQSCSVESNMESTEKILDPKRSTFEQPDSVCKSGKKLAVEQPISGCKSEKKLADKKSLLTYKPEKKLAAKPFVSTCKSEKKFASEPLFSVFKSVEKLTSEQTISFCKSEKKLAPRPLQKDTVTYPLKNPVVCLTKLDPKKIMYKVKSVEGALPNPPCVSEAAEHSTGDKKALKKAEIKKSAWYEDEGSLSDISVSDVSDLEDMTTDNNAQSTSRVPSSKVKEMKRSLIKTHDTDKFSKAVSKSFESNSDHHKISDSKVFPHENKGKTAFADASHSSSTKSKKLGSNSNTPLSQSHKGSSNNSKVKMGHSSKSVDISKVIEVGPKPENKSKRPHLLQESRKRKASKDESILATPFHFIEKSQKLEVKEVKNDISNNWRFELKLSPFGTEDLCNEAIRKFINLASDCAINFDSSHEIRQGQGEVHLYFGCVSNLQTGIQKLSQLSLPSPKILHGVIKCLHFKPSARKDSDMKFTPAEEIKLGFYMYSSWAEKVKRLVQSKDWKRDDKSQRKCAIIQRIPPFLSNEMLSLLFPFSYKVHTPKSITGDQKKVNPGYTEVEFENTAWMETILSCFRDFYISKIDASRPPAGNPMCKLSILNFKPPFEKIPVTPQSKEKPKDTRQLKGPAESKQKDHYNKGRSSDTYGMPSRRSDSYHMKDKETVPSGASGRYESRKRSFPTNEEVGAKSAVSAKNSRTTKMPSNARSLDRSDGSSFQESEKQGLRSIAQAKGFDPNNTDVLRILEVYNQLTSLQELFSCAPQEGDTVGGHAEKGYSSERAQGHHQSRKLTSKESADISAAEQQIRENIAIKQRQLKELEVKLKKKRGMQVETQMEGKPISNLKLQAGRNDEPLDFTKPAPKIEEAVQKDAERSKLFVSKTPKPFVTAQHQSGKKDMSKAFSTSTEDFALPLQFGKNVKKAASEVIANESRKSHDIQKYPDSRRGAWPTNNSPHFSRKRNQEKGALGRIMEQNARLELGDRNRFGDGLLPTPPLDQTANNSTWDKQRENLGNRIHEVPKYEGAKGRSFPKGRGRIQAGDRDTFEPDRFPKTEATYIHGSVPERMSPDFNRRNHNLREDYGEGKGSVDWHQELPQNLRETGSDRGPRKGLRLHSTSEKFLQERFPEESGRFHDSMSNIPTVSVRSEEQVQGWNEEEKFEAFEAHAYNRDNHSSAFMGINRMPEDYIFDKEMRGEVRELEGRGMGQIMRNRGLGMRGRAVDSERGIRARETSKELYRDFEMRDRDYEYEPQGDFEIRGRGTEPQMGVGMSGTSIENKTDFEIIARDFESIGSRGRGFGMRGRNSEPQTGRLRGSAEPQRGGMRGRGFEPPMGGMRGSAEPQRGGMRGSAEPPMGGMSGSAEPQRGGMGGRGFEPPMGEMRGSAEPQRGGMRGSAEPQRGGMRGRGAEPQRGGMRGSAEPQRGGMRGRGFGTLGRGTDPQRSEMKGSAEHQMSGIRGSAEHQRSEMRGSAEHQRSEMRGSAEHQRSEMRGSAEPQRGGMRGSAEPQRVGMRGRGFGTLGRGTEPHRGGMKGSVEPQRSVMRGRGSEPEMGIRMSGFDAEHETDIEMIGRDFETLSGNRGGGRGFGTRGRGFGTRGRGTEPQRSEMRGSAEPERGGMRGRGFGTLGRGTEPERGGMRGRGTEPQRGGMRGRGTEPQMDRMRGRGSEPEMGIRMSGIDTEHETDIEMIGRDFESMSGNGGGGRGFGMGGKDAEPQRWGTRGRGMEPQRSGMRGRSSKPEMGIRMSETNTEHETNIEIIGRDFEPKSSNGMRGRGFGMRGRGAELQRGVGRGIAFARGSGMREAKRNFQNDIEMSGGDFEPPQGIEMRMRDEEPQRVFGMRGRDAQPQRGIGMRGRGAEPQCGSGMREVDMEHETDFESNLRNFKPAGGNRRRGRDNEPQRGIGMRGEGGEPERGIGMKGRGTEPQRGIGIGGGGGDNEGHGDGLFSERSLQSSRGRGLARRGGERNDGLLETPVDMGIIGRGRGIKDGIRERSRGMGRLGDEFGEEFQNPQRGASVGRGFSQGARGMGRGFEYSQRGGKANVSVESQIPNNVFWSFDAPAEFRENEMGGSFRERGNANVAQDTSGGILSRSSLASIGQMRGNRNMSRGTSRPGAFGLR